MRNNRIFFVFPAYLALLAVVFWLMQVITEFEPAPALVAPVGAQDWNPTSTPTPEPTATPTPTATPDIDGFYWHPTVSAAALFIANGTKAGGRATDTHYMRYWYSTSHLPAGEGHYGSEGIDIIRTTFKYVSADGITRLDRSGDLQMHDDHESGDDIQILSIDGNTIAAWGDEYVTQQADDISRLTSGPLEWYPVKVTMTDTQDQDIYIDGTPGQYGTGSLVGTEDGTLVLEYKVNWNGSVFSISDVTADSTHE